VLTIVALVLALLFLPSPWGLIAVIVAAVIDVIETAGFVWWSKRRRRLTRVAVGVDDLVGRSAVAVTTLAPEGQVRIQGEVWAARSATRIDRDASVVVRSVDGLVLVVKPADGNEAAPRTAA
jgi:membrane-bound ClpP family serine protease